MDVATLIVPCRREVALRQRQLDELERTVAVLLDDSGERQAFFDRAREDLPRLG